ncbi:MAG: hypothetical protein ACRC77_12795 [Bacteroidales bacterium]
MKRKILSCLSLTLLFIILISCVHEQHKSIDTEGDKVFVTFNPTNILSTGVETQINKFRIIVFNSAGMLEFNKQQDEMESPSRNLYKMELRPGMYTLYGIGNEPDDLFSQLNDIRTPEALDILRIGDVRSIPENNLPLIWKRTIYVRATGLDASVGQVSLTNSPDDSGWSSTLPMQMERMAAKISISARKGNPLETINMTKVEIKQIPAYTTFGVNTYPINGAFFSNTFEWKEPMPITSDANAYTELISGQIIAENIPATESGKTAIYLEYTRNGLPESALIPFEGNVERNRLYQYQIKITELKIVIEAVSVLPWNEESTHISIPGGEISFSQIEVPYSYNQNSVIYFTTSNIPAGNIKLEYAPSYEGVNESNRFTADTKLTYNYDKATRRGYGNLTIRRAVRSIDRDTLIVNVAGLRKGIIVRGVDIAGSNIYLDETTKQLTFDDVPRGGRSPHDTYQGLYFVWGGLTAVSPSESYSNFVPTPVLWSATGDLNPKNPLPQGADLSPGTLMLFDPDNGAGDICEYMTRRGIAPAGKKWRAPRSGELYGAATPNIKITGAQKVFPFNGQGEINDGVHYPPFYFFPASGYVNQQINDGKLVARTVSDCPQFNLNERATPLKGSTKTVAMYKNPSYGEIDRASGYGSVGYTVRCLVDDTPGEVIPLYVISYDFSENHSGTITAPTPEGIILNQHVNAGGNVVLSNLKLTSSNGLLHRGWLVDGKEYPLGGTITNVQKDYTVKPLWGYSRTLALKADGTIGFWDFTDGTNLNVLFFKWGGVIGCRIPDADYVTIKKGIFTYYREDWIGFNPSELTIGSDYFNIPTTIQSGEYPDISVENIKKGLGDPCRLVGYTVDEIKGYISKNQLPPDKGWRMPEVSLDDPKYGMPAKYYYTTIANTGYPGAWITMQRNGANTVYSEFLPAVSRIVSHDSRGMSWNYPYSQYMTKTVVKVSPPENYQYMYQLVTYDVTNNPMSWITMQQDSHQIRCVPKK